MAQFMGSVQGKAGEATRLGSKRFGLTVKALSWAGQIETRMWTTDAGVDMVEITAGPHPKAASGPSRVLYHGEVALAAVSA